MSFKTELQRSDLQAVFDYEPVSGVLVKKNTNKVVTYPEFDDVAKASFQVNSKNYRIPAHTLVWMLYYGKWPEGMIFHKDFNQFNLRITNLVDITRAENYKILSAYKNLTDYCDIKPHFKDKHTFMVRYICNGRLKCNQYHDIEYAQKACQELKEKFRRVVVELGGIPPV